MTKTPSDTTTRRDAFCLIAICNGNTRGIANAIITTSAAILQTVFAITLGLAGLQFEFAIAHASLTGEH